jgi:hypothetical protein
VVLAGEGVGGEDAVALADLADGLGGALGHEHGGGGEAAPSAAGVGSALDDVGPGRRSAGPSRRAPLLVIDRTGG